MRILIAGAFFALAPAAALAAAPVDNYAADAVLKAKYGEAIAHLADRVAQDPADESAMINLAIAYRHTGRVEESRRLYQRVLRLDDVALNTAAGVEMSSHEVARRALGTQISSR